AISDALVHTFENRLGDSVAAATGIQKHGSVASERMPMTTYGLESRPAQLEKCSGPVSQTKTQRPLYFSRYRSTAGRAVVHAQRALSPTPACSSCGPASLHVATRKGASFTAFPPFVRRITAGFGCCRAFPFRVGDTHGAIQRPGKNKMAVSKTAKVISYTPPRPP